jgi:ornithine--oxo-acid transaminase
MKPSADAARLMDLANRYGARNYAPLPVVLERGEGVYVYDTEGREYIDFLSSYSALSHGHRHPRLLAAAQAQLEKITLTSRAFHNAEMGPFLHELCEYADMSMALPMNTGAEAVETAIKAARKWAYAVKGVPRHEADIIVCADNFHGRTVTIISFSTENLYRDDFGPFTPGFTVIPYGDVEALAAAITPNTAAFMVEPLQGEAGVAVPPAGFLEKAQELCATNDVLFVLDEVQTGLGRTGRRFCYQHEDVHPDMIIVGKALGGGIYPVSAVVGKMEILSLFRPGEHGSTFGGNPLGAAVAREALRVLEEEQLASRSAELGEYLMGRLRAIQSPYVKEVRGKGLLIGLVLHPDAGGARRFCVALMEEGLLCKETHEDVIRFAPPLVISREQLDWALERVENIITTI